MTTGAIPILQCDHEDGCEEYITNYYEMCADNWRERMPGWYFDPYEDVDTAYCPKHRTDSPAYSAHSDRTVDAVPGPAA
jgi:hypothetical protein